jgi:alpha-tubulin suppressor-like RCC1 family protein
LGDGTQVDRSTPVAVPGLAGVRALSTSNLHSPALLADGTVRAWGYDFYGNLGDGTRESRLVPTPVAQLNGVKMP